MKTQLRKLEDIDVCSEQGTSRQAGVKVEPAETFFGRSSLGRGIRGGSRGFARGRGFVSKDNVYRPDRKMRSFDELCQGG